MKFLMRYSPSILSLTFGILVEEGLYIPTRGTGSGHGFIIVGMLLLLFNFYMEYLEFKDSKDDEKVRETKTLIDYFCTIFVVFGFIYFGLFLFEIVSNYFIFIVMVLSFGFCGKSIRKFIYS